MFTPEDSLDMLDEELGRRRRRLWSMESAPYEGRVGDPDTLARSIHFERQAIAELERERAGIIAEQVAEAEGFAA